MKIVSFLSIGSGLALLTGCVHSHRSPAYVYSPVYSPPPVYSPTPEVITEPTVVTPKATVVTPAPTVIAPTSDRSVVRVYPEPSTIVDSTAATPAVSSRDLMTADTIRKMMMADPILASAARNVRIAVLNDRITMTGTVLTQHDRETLHSAIVGIPGGYEVDDRVQVELNR